LSTKQAERERNESKYRNHESVCAAATITHPPSGGGKGYAPDPFPKNKRKTGCNFSADFDLFISFFMGGNV
jgi:hypothetical protein